MPAETFKYGWLSIFVKPRDLQLGKSQFVVSDLLPPNQGMRTCPPWVWPAKIKSISSLAIASKTLEYGACVTPIESSPFFFPETLSYSSNSR